MAASTRYARMGTLLPFTSMPPRSSRSKTGAAELKCRATNRLGETQPMEPLWNPSGYMRNVVETMCVQVG